MRRFLNKLMNDFRSTRPARPARRAALQVEGLEDRLVLSTARLIGPTLFVNASPGFVEPSPPGHPRFHIRTISFQVDQANHAKLDVLDSGTLLGEFPIASVKDVKISVAGLDRVSVDDTLGLPFAGGTNVTLSGSGSLNSLKLEGSRVIDGGETFVAGNGSAGSLALGGVTFGFSSTIGSVTDLVETTDTLVVKAFDGEVSLSGSDGVTQTLSGLSQGGAGDSLTFGNKARVDLEDFFNGGNVSLNATKGAAGEQTFRVDLKGANQVAFLNATPSTVTTDVHADGTSALLLLLANDGPVSMEGQANSLTEVRVEEVPPIGGPTTAFIKADVSVSNVASLTVEDGGNHSTPENVKVTESTIAGTGLFGNNAVRLSYNGVASLVIVTGQLADTYTVEGSHAGARFNSVITIEDGSQKGLAVTVGVDRGSGLSLNLLNNFLSQPAPASLLILAPGATINPLDPSPGTGLVDVKFAGGLDSQVFYEDFTSVTAINSFPHL